MRRPHRRRLELAVAIAAALSVMPAAAHADPISAAILSAVGVSAATVGATAAAIATFVLTSALTLGASLGLNTLFGPKAPAAASQDRQADVLSLDIGEVPREMIVGRAATGGSLVDCCNYGGKYNTDWNLFVIALADHECDGIEGFYVNDTYVAWPFGAGSGGGEVPGYNGQLHVHCHLGTASDPRWPNSDGVDAWEDLLPCLGQGMMKGVCAVAYAYKADAADAQNPVWSGRPTLLFVMRGAKVYDPRLDDTVAGGAGPQRWETPSTWAWSENASLCEYAFQRGVYALNQIDQPGMLLVGRGLSDLEAPPERVIPAANLCDELVDAPGGGQEARYRVGGVIKSSDTFQDVAQMFGDATAGVVTQPEGSVFVAPGEAQTPVETITDADLPLGQAVKFSPFKSDSDRVNTVIARYVEPAQKWAETSAPVSRDLDDLANDGGPRELTLTLTLVPYVGQASRVAEIRRRQARLERTATIVLGPRFAHLEEGDWIGWTSDRRFAGGTVYFRVTAYGLDQAWRNTLALEEIDFDVYGFGGMGAEPVGPEPAEAPGALELDDVAIVATHLQGAPVTPGGVAALVPAVEATWATPVDPAISTVRLEVRLGADGAVTPTSTTAVSKGELITTAGVAANVTTLQARLVPLGDPARPVTPSPWVTLSTGDLVASSTTGLSGTNGPVSVDALVADIYASDGRLQTALDAAASALAKALGVGEDLDQEAYAGLLGVLTEDQVEAYAKANTVDTKTLRSSVTDMIVSDPVTGAWSVKQDRVIDANGYTASENLTLLGSNFATNLANAVSLLETKTDSASAVAQLHTQLTAETAQAIATATSTLISYADATSAIAVSQTNLRAEYQGAIATATSGLVSFASMTSAISAATINLASQVDVSTAVATATSGLVTQAGLSSALAGYNLALNSSFAGAVGALTVNYQTYSDVQQAIGVYDTALQSSVPGGLSASVRQQAITVADHDGKLQAFLQLSATTPAGEALVRLLSAATGSEVLLDAAKIFFGSRVLVETATGTLHFQGNSYQLCIGEEFGANGNLLLWFGSVSTPTTSMTKGNAVLYISTDDGKLGGPGLPSTGGGGGAGVKVYNAPSWPGSGTVYADTITCASGGFLTMALNLPTRANEPGAGNYAFYINGQGAGGGSFTSRGTEEGPGGSYYEVDWTGAGQSLRIQVPAGAISIQINSSCDAGGWASQDAFEVSTEFFPIIS